jgi:hypothetical protein
VLVTVYSPLVLPRCNAMLQHARSPIGVHPNLDRTIASR